MDIRHILVATDLSDDGKRCWSPVMELARSLGARVTLLHVVEGLAGIPHGAPLAPPLQDPGLEPRVSAARTALEERRLEFGAGMQMQADVITAGETATAIADYADAHDVDLIALSTHGRTGFRHLMVGSVAEGVVRHSRVPMIVFPRPKA